MEGHMKRNNIKILTAVLALLLLLSGCINAQKEEEEGTTAPIDMNDINPSSIGSYKTMEYRYFTNVDVTRLTTNLDKAYLILANKTTALGEDYEPSSMEALTCKKLESGRTYMLESRAAQALYAMLAEMQAEDVTDIMVASAYRSYDKQLTTYESHLKREMNEISSDAYRVFGSEYIQMNYLDKKIYKLTLEDAHTVVQSYSALPGQSEHQTGLCIDFATYEEGDEPLTEAFETTAAYRWLSQNAYKFGFILRYPEGKENITGYTYEPWHYRFVGREAATDIYNGGMTLEQYLQLVAE